jgi:hypothetical protein
MSKPKLATAEGNGPTLPIALASNDPFGYRRLAEAAVAECIASADELLAFTEGVLS